MKKIILVMLSIVVMIANGCSVKREIISEPIKALVNSSTNESERKSFFIADESQKLIVSGSADYRFFTPEQVWGRAELVVIGTFSENLGSYVEADGRVFTKAMVKIEKLVKGKILETEVIVTFKGGIVPLHDYLNTFDTESIKKMGIDPSLVGYRDTVSDDFGKFQANPVFGQQYLIMLNKVEDLKEYFLGSDSLSMLEVEREKYKDITREEWESISDLIKN